MRPDSPAFNAVAEAIRDEITGIYFADSADLARAAIEAFMTSLVGGSELLARADKLSTYLDKSGDRESADMLALLVIECRRLQENLDGAREENASFKAMYHQACDWRDAKIRALNGLLDKAAGRCERYCTPGGRAGPQPTCDESYVRAVGRVLREELAAIDLSAGLLKLADASPSSTPEG